MSLWRARALLCAAAQALALAGCGDQKGGQPRVADPNAPKLQQKSPGGPGPAAGKAPPGPRGGVQ